MSFLPLSDLSSVDASLGTRALPVAGEATEPSVVRNGSTAAKRAYQEGLAFEQLLVNELAQELASTVSSSSSDASDGDGSDDGSDDGSGDSSSGLLGSGAASGYESVIPGALTTAIMSAGGTGLALQFAQAIDPSAFAQRASSREAAAHSSATNEPGSSRKETK